MNRYKYKLEVVVEVYAYDEDDAGDAIEDTFGVGSDGNVDVKELTIVNCEPV